MYDISDQLNTKSVKSARHALTAWILAAASIAVVFVFSASLPSLDSLQYVFTYLHEAGHVFVAEASGGNATELVVHDRGGHTLATSQIGLRSALVAAGGLLFAPLLAWVLAFTLRWPRVQRVFWGLFTVVLVIYTLPICRSAPALISGLIVVALTGALTWIKHNGVRQYLSGLVIFSMLASAYQSRHYMFATLTDTVTDSGGADVISIAEELGGPPLLWSVLIAAFTGVVTFAILRIIYKTADAAIPE